AMARARKRRLPTLAGRAEKVLPSAVQQRLAAQLRREWRKRSNPRLISQSVKRGAKTVMKRKTKNPSPQIPNGGVHFELNHPAAEMVCIAGSFNEWHPEATPMIPSGDGLWRKDLNLLPGRYEYRLVVDGQWVDDPTAKETVPNPFGGLNAVLEVTDS